MTRRDYRTALGSLFGHKDSTTLEVRHRSFDGHADETQPLHRAFHVDSVPAGAGRV